MCADRMDNMTSRGKVRKGARNHVLAILEIMMQQCKRELTTCHAHIYIICIIIILQLRLVVLLIVDFYPRLHIGPMIFEKAVLNYP